MITSKVMDLIKKHLYVVYNESFISTKGSTYTHRFIAKHPGLKPEIIVENDSFEGFKNKDKKQKSLEGFPIYIDIEGEHENGEYQSIDHIDMYSESSLKPTERLSDLVYISHFFNDSVVMDRSIRFGDSKKDSLIIISKINECLPVENDFDEFQNSILGICEELLIDFVQCIQCVNDILVHNKSIARLQSEGLC